MTARHKITFFLTALILTACSTRGPLLPVPAETPPSETVDVFVATNRAEFLQQALRGRAEKTRHFRYEIRVPTDHVPGELKLPGRRNAPNTHFLTQSAVEFPSEAGFTRDIRSRLSRLPASDRTIFVYIHGFNNSFAEGLVRLAQLEHDLDLPGVAVHFSWPSAASPLGYAYDRDSVLYSRDALESLLRSMPETRGRIVLVAHSMGSHLAMETLRQIEIASPGWGKRRLGGVLLFSPDIDLDVFRQQAARIGPLPQPFAVFISDRDHILNLSATISGEESRLGTLSDAEELADLEITLMNVSDFSEGVGHFNVGDSPALINILRQLARFDSSFDGEGQGRTDLIPGTILTVRNVTEIILSPLSVLDAQ